MWRFARSAAFGPGDQTGYRPLFFQTTELTIYAKWAKSAVISTTHDAGAVLAGCSVMRVVNGFTFIELVVVILIVGIVALSIAPRFAPLNIDVGVQAEQVAADIRYAQSLSMTSGQRHCINFTASNYQIRNATCTNPVVHPATQSSAAIGVSGMTIAVTNLTGSNLEFDGKGQPTTFTVAANSATITLSGGSDTSKITVCPVTGRVKIEQTATCP